MGKDPYHKLIDHLMAYRATPHPTTGKSPAEMLFGRKFNTNIPDRRQSMATGREDIQQAREKDRLRKQQMKTYRDAGTNIRPHNIEQGDLILLRRKSTKHQSMYDPEPYLAVAVRGTQITGAREGHRDKTRDAQRWKKYEIQDTDLQPLETETGSAEDLDIGAGPNFQKKVN